MWRDGMTRPISYTVIPLTITSTNNPHATYHHLYSTTSQTSTAFHSIFTPFHSALLISLPKQSTNTILHTYLYPCIPYSLPLIPQSYHHIQIVQTLHLYTHRFSFPSAVITLSFHILHTRNINIIIQTYPFHFTKWSFPFTPRVSFHNPKTQVTLHYILTYYTSLLTHSLPRHMSHSTTSIEHKPQSTYSSSTSRAKLTLPFHIHHPTTHYLPPATTTTIPNQSTLLSPSHSTPFIPPPTV